MSGCFRFKLFCFGQIKFFGVIIDGLDVFQVIVSIGWVVVEYVMEKLLNFVSLEGGGIGFKLYDNCQEN